MRPLSFLLFGRHWQMQRRRRRGELLHIQLACTDPCWAFGETLACLLVWEPFLNAHAPLAGVDVFFLFFPCRWAWHCDLYIYWNPEREP